MAAGRKISLEKAHELAKGRVYTGDEALKLGLVDTLGGFYEAFAIAKKSLGVAETRPVKLKIFPRRLTFRERFFGRGPDNSEDITNDNTHQLAVLPEQSVLKKIIQAGAMSIDNNDILKMEEPWLY